jgi:hypothetical protein
MNKQCSTSVSLPGSKLHLSPTRYRRRQLNRFANPSRRRQVSDRRLNAATFERFLCWLGPDPESAGRKYELIRSRLIMMFRARRCVFAEDLADATFERVARKVGDVAAGFTGDPARYFYGVAKKIYLEYQHEITAVQLRSESSLRANSESNDLERMLQQLDEALSMIRKSDRELILRYYSGSERNKINDRRVLAEQFGLRPNALRLRVFRIKRQIKGYLLRFTADAPV